MAPKQNDNQAHFFAEDAENTVSQTVRYSPGKNEETKKPPAITLAEKTESGVETGRDCLQSTFNSSMQEALGITENELTTLTGKLGKEEIHATIDSWSDALGIEEQEEPAATTLDGVAGGTFLEAEKATLSPTVDSVIKSLGLDEVEEKPTPIMEQLESTLKTGIEGVVLPIDAGIKSLGLEEEEMASAECTLVENLSLQTEGEQEDKPKTLQHTTLLPIMQSD